MQMAKLKCGEILSYASYGYWDVYGCLVYVKSPIIAQAPIAVEQHQATATGVFRNSAFIWFLDGNENKVDISIVGTNGKFFLINAHARHGVLRRMGAATEIPSILICPNFHQESLGGGGVCMM